MTEAANKQEI